mgnify:FL=1|jgi:hypothetical protein
MDFSAVSQLISSVGFPIAACVALFWQMNRESTQHKEEMDALKESLNQNTLAITKLVLFMQEKEGMKPDEEA